MKNLYVGFGIIILFGLGGLWWKNISFPVKQPQETENQINQVDEKIRILIEDGSQKQEFEQEYEEGLTALEATKIVTQGNIESKGEGTMAYITSINGRLARENEHEFWEFLVNGKQAVVGAGSYVIQKGDIITWRINTY